MAERPYLVLSKYSGRVEVPPWTYDHPTYSDIKAGRPIIAEEAQWLLDELERLHALEKLWASVAYEMVGARDAAIKALAAIGDPTTP